MGLSLFPHNSSVKVGILPPFQVYCNQYMLTNRTYAKDDIINRDKPLLIEEFDDYLTRR